MNDHITVSTIDKSTSVNQLRRSFGFHLGDKTARLLHLDPSGDQLGEKHEEINLGHRKNDVGKDKLISIHRKADEDDHHQDIFLSLYKILDS